MILRIQSDRSIRLDDAYNFRAFKVLVDAANQDLEPVGMIEPDTLRFDDAYTAWVSIAFLQTIAGCSDDADWQRGFEVMIAAAVPHGWIAPDRKSIKAHVEWAREAKAASQPRYVS